MGFYAPAQIVRDAHEHGVEIRPADANFSAWHCTLEPPSQPSEAVMPGLDPGIRGASTGAVAGDRSGDGRVRPRHDENGGGRTALRLGLRQIKGLAEDDAARLVAARGEGYRDASDLWQRSGLGRAALERLADADALRSLGLDRRRALWALKALGEPPLPLFAKHLGSASQASSAGLTRGTRGHLREGRVKPGQDGERFFASETRAAALLPEMALGEHVVEDYAALGLTLKRHPLAFLRTELAGEGLVPARDLTTLPVGRRLEIAGLVLIRQRPGSANGVVFITIEDETGIANLIVWPDILDRFRRTALGATLLCCKGRLQREESVIHLVADELRDLTPRLNSLRDRTGDAPPTLKPAFASLEKIPDYGPRDIVIPSRNFR
jgi:error-prone DNA polymerase